jgi:hypothetical protein
MDIPQWPSARLTHGLKLATGQRHLRFSVLRGTPMTSAITIQFQKAKMLRKKQLSMKGTSKQSEA